MPRTPLPEDASVPALLSRAVRVDPSMVDRAWRVLPAGCNGEFNLPKSHSMVLDHAKGCFVWDASGREFVDFSMGWGSVLVGHARSEIVHAVVERTVQGSNFSHTNTASVPLAEELVRLSPACERVRFCASGTEATMYCMRLARAYMERTAILKFEGAYHGANDEGTISVFPSGETPFPNPEPTSAGVPSADVLVAPFNDLATTEAIVREHGDRMAAIIVEPFHRCLPPVRGFLEGLRGLTLARNCLLIFDEVVTGFRLAYGGAQERYGVVPDLVAYGKALGGGLPIGAYGGRADIMELVREELLGKRGYVWTASTLGGNPVSCAAASAALEVFRRPGTYERLFALGEYFREGLRRELVDSGHPGQVIGDGPLAQIVFSTQPIIDTRSMLSADRAKGRAMMLALVEEGVFLNPMGTKLYLSLAHDEAVCDEFCRRLERVLARLPKG